MTLSLDPLDLFESALRRGTARGESLLGLDFPAALEFSALRFVQWRDAGEDLLTLFPDLAGWPALKRLRALAGRTELLRPDNGLNLPFLPGDTRVGVQQLSASSKEWAPGGVFAHFQEQFRMALRGSGMEKDFASALAGALHEMASNAVEHSASPAPPVACFEVGRGSWSFAVVDIGRGVLASLKDNPAYGSILSETEALTLALRPGVSRFADSGRGMGFASVFKALVDHQAALRFRSGGAAARWEGRSLTNHSIEASALSLPKGGFRVRIQGPLNSR